MLILSSGTKRQIVYNKKLCECCETKCSAQLSTNLKYCCFDAITKGVLRPSTKENIASVDCIKDASNNGVVLLEIKNQKPSNIEISDVSLKIKETMQYLHDHEPSLFRPYNTKFFLAIPSKKYTQILCNPDNFSDDMRKFTLNLVNQIVRVFNDNEYKIKIDTTDCRLKSKIIQCEDTDILCK